MEDQLANSTASAPEALVSAFVDAFNAADASRCVSFYAEDAVIYFMAVTYRGHPAIEQWLTQRFAAGAQIVEVSGVDVNDDTITAHATLTSRKLQSWRLGTINGRATLRLDDDQRIVECRLGWDGFKPRAR